MAEKRVERRLAAVFAGDVAGYSRLMGADEEGTLRRLNAHRREFLEPKIAEHRGRIVKRTGDGILIEFASAVDAGRCAVEIQRGMERRNKLASPDQRFELRIGIHVGDIIIEEGDIFGDGVNVAARLEAIAEPGGICISDDAYRQVRDKLDAAFEDTGEQQLKNISRPVRVYRLKFSESGTPQPLTPALALPDRPSIAVLPFQNMSGDPEQDYFCDGMAEDIITALSRFKNLFVIARNSSFTYKGRAVDIKQIGRELGVRYILEGSVRKAGNRLRITGQLIDAITGAHLWAERFDDALEEVFDLQDKVTARVAAAIFPTLEQAEFERSKRKQTDSLDAYDYYLRAMAKFHQQSNEAISEAIQLYYKAIEIDPGFAAAYGMAAWCFTMRRANGWTADRDQEITESERLALRAVELGKDDPLALHLGGFSLAYVGLNRLDAGDDCIERALLLNPNLANAWMASGYTKIYIGEPDRAIERLMRAMQLSPLDPFMYTMRNGMALAHLHMCHYDEACLWAGRALREQPNFVPAARILAAGHAFAGRMDEAQAAVATLQSLDPLARVSNVAGRVAPWRRPDDLARMVEGLRKAGLPE
jgi:TolB-like protein